MKYDKISYKSLGTNKTIFFPYVRNSFLFVGRFKFGAIKSLQQIARKFNLKSSGFSNNTSLLIVDDKNRKDSKQIDKARDEGIIILKEEDFFKIINKILKEGVF